MGEPVLSEERRLRFHAALRAVDGVGLEGASVLGDGYVSQAWLLADGETVARIPKFGWAERDLEYELAILPALERAGLPVETPRGARGVYDASGLAGGLHRMVRGRALVERSEAIVASGGVERLAGEVASFLSALHAVPVAEVPPPEADPWPKDFARWTEAVRPWLDERGKRWIDWLRTRLSEVAAPAGQPSVVTHGDLWRHHLLLDDDDQLCGVIDFGLASVMDAAWDLRSFADGSGIAKVLGSKFTDVVFERYAGVLDEHARERAAVYYALDVVGDAYYELMFLGGTHEFVGRLQGVVEQWDGTA